MEIEKDVDFLGLEAKTIGKGERAGQVFYILKFISGDDSFECTIFDNPEVIEKLKTVQRYQPLIVRLKIKQDNNSNLKWNLVDLTV